MNFKKDSVMNKINNLLIAFFPVLFASCGDDSADNPLFDNTEVPAIYISWQENMAVSVGDTIRLNPQISPSDGVTYKWLFNGEEISDTKDLLYVVTDFGEYRLDYEIERYGVKNSRTSVVLVTKPFEEKKYKKMSIAYLSKDGAISDIQWNSITHLILTSSVIQADGLPDLTLGETAINIPALISTAHNYGVYVLIEYSGELGSYINGAPVYASYNFYNAAVDATNRGAFITKLVNFALENNFDGINVYMDKAADGLFTNPVELRNFYEELAAAVPDNGSVGKFHLSMSVVGGWTRASLQGVVDIPRYDWINVLAYGAEDLTPGPHASQWFFTSEAEFWKEAGVDPERIAVAVPAFGLRYFGNVSDYTWGNLWQYTEYSGYRAICNQYPDAPGKNKIEVDNGLYYDGLNDVKQKAEYIVAQGYAGMAVWTIDNDNKEAGKSLTYQINVSLGNSVLGN